MGERQDIMDIKNKEKPLKILSFQQNQGFYFGAGGGTRTMPRNSKTLAPQWI